MPPSGERPTANCAWGAEASVRTVLPVTLEITSNRLPRLATKVVGILADAAARLVLADPVVLVAGGLVVGGVELTGGAGLVTGGLGWSTVGA